MDIELEGKVKWFNTKKGYGFIISDNKDYFVHFRSIMASGFKNLNEGDKVLFKSVRSDKGFQAENVRIVL